MKHNNSKGQVTAQVTLDEMGRSGFDYDNVQYGTGRIGRLYPVRCDFVYPDDTYKSDTTAVLNFKPLLVPLMTNMHVKQEHFYVPFNTVWDNWDLFISNGEKNDYCGLVPSISMESIVNAINIIVTNNGNFPIFNTGFGLYGNMHLDTTEDRPNWKKQPYISIPEYFAFWNGEQLLGLPMYYLSTFDFDATPFANWLKARQMDDLYEHVQPLVGQMYEYILNMRRLGENDIFRPISSYYLGDSATQGDATTPVNAYSNFFKFRESEIDAADNRYLRKIAPALQNLCDSEGYIPFVPTQHGMNLLRMLYDVYKPIIGLSSNLDMLGYNKLRFEDFLYVIMVQILTTYKFTVEEATANAQVDIALSTEHFQSIQYHSNLSEKPQSILPLRALYSIWLNNYRDQLLETDAPNLVKSDVITDDEIVTLITPRLRCWHKDAFTTSLDNPGTGNVGVTTSSAQQSRYIIEKINKVNNETRYNQINDDGSNIAEISIGDTNWRIPTSYLSGINSLVIADYDSDPVNAGGFSLFQLDAARRAQKFLQKALFYGNRIQDFLFTHWQVKFLDARLRLPELVATSSDMVQMQQIVANNTIVTEKSTNVAGDKAGYAYSQAFTNNIDHYIPEHGVVISMLSVIPDCVYSNTFDRHLAMLDQFDFPFPDFATLGMQAVYENEMMQLPVKILTADSEFSDDVAVHGYQGMYYADKSKFNNVHGDLLDTENVYVMDREFNLYDPDARPKLNYVFVHCHPKLDAFVIENEWSDYFRFDVYHNQGINRKLPAHSIYI